MFETATISAVALYRETPSIVDGELRDRLNAGLMAFGLSFTPDTPQSDEILAFTNGSMRVSLTPRNTPDLPGDFVRPLTASYTRIRPNDYAARVGAHGATVTITVADARADRTIPIPETTFIVVCHAALVGLIAQARPLVIHWRQSDMMVLPAEVPPIRGIGFPVSLATRPEVSQARPDPRGRTRFGLRFEKSEIFFGKPVVVEPTSHPMPEVLTLIDFCIMRRLGGEDLLTDGATVGLPGPVEITVRHLPPTEALPAGSISLSLRTPLPRPQPARPLGLPDMPIPRRATPLDQPRLTSRDGSETRKAQRSDRG